jgi:hypothetical protein
MQRFTDYVNKRQFNLADFMLDEGEGQQFGGQRFPIPLNLAMLLSLVPGGPSMQGQALKYVMTDALYRAAKGRQILAKQMSQKLGREVKEYEVFSPDVHAQDPQVAALWKQMAPEYFEKYEPKHIRLDFGGKTGDVLISLSKLNALLGQHGLPPLEFGGPKGLVELMESGRKWAKPFQSIVPPHGDGPQHDRSGIDLSHPRIHQYADKPHEPRVAFGFSPNMDGDKREYREPGWEPKINTPYYTRRLSQWLRRMSDKAEALMQGIPDDDPQKEQFAQLFGSITKGMTRGSESVQDKTFGQGGGFVPFDDVEEYEEIKKKVADGLNAFNAMPDNERVLAGVPLRKAKPEELEAMMKKMFPLEQDEEGNMVPARDEQGNLLVNQQVSGFGPYRDAGKAGSKLLISSILNWLHFGTTNTPQGAKGKVNPQRGDFNPMILNQDLPGLDDVFEKPVSTQKVIEGGLSTDILKRDYPDYFPMDDSEGTVESKIAGMKPFYLTDGKDEIKFHFDKKSGNWIASQMTGQGERHTSFKRKDWGGSPIVLPGNDQFGGMRSHSFDHIPVFGKNREKLIAMWDKFAQMTGGGREEEAQIVKKKAATQVRGRGGDNDFDALKDDAIDPWQAFEKLLGSPKFFFGDTGKHFAQLLAKNNFEPHEAKEIAGIVNDMLSSGKLPTPEAMKAEFGPEGEQVYNLLLQNGKGWRIGTTAALLSGHIADVKKLRSKEKSGVGGAPNQDGQTQDVMANAGTNAAALRQAAGADASVALSGKLNRSISGRGVIGTGEKADISKIKGHVSGTGIYKQEGEAAVGPTNVETFNQFYDHFKNSYQSQFKPNDVESLWTVNAAINKLQNTHPSGEVVRAAGNAAVMDVLHDEIKKHAAIVKKGAAVKQSVSQLDTSKRALAYILFNMFFNPQGGLKDILTSDEEDESSVDTEPLVTQVKPLLQQDKDMAKYFTMLRDGEPLEFAPPAEEKPGLKVVGQTPTVPVTAPAKPTFGGTSGGGLSTTNQPPQQGFEFHGQYYDSEQDFFDIVGDFDRATMDEYMPPNTWQQLPPHIRDKVTAQYNRENMTGLQKVEMMSIHQYLTMLRETDAVFDGSKPTTFNWWGAVGDPLGKVIDGDVPVKKKKRKHAGK